jgi:2-enoate reductase
VGGGLVGCETALHLASKGKKVILTTRRKKEDLALDLNLVNRKALIEELQRAEISIIENSKLQSIEERDVTIEDRKWEKVRIETETVVIAGGFKPQTEIYDNLVEKGFEVYAVGDCVKPRDIRFAISEGYHLARRL